MLLVWILERRKGKAWRNPILFRRFKGTNIYYSVMHCIWKEGVKAFFLPLLVLFGQKVLCKKKKVLSLQNKIGRYGECAYLICPLKVFFLSSVG